VRTIGIKLPCRWRAAGGEEGFGGDLAADEGAFARLRASLDPCWIEEALEATGTATLRRRRLPAEQVVWLVLGMALYRDRPIDELVERLDLVLPSSGAKAMAKSAVAQARDRLGEEPLKWLFERCAEKWGHESARRHSWRGLAVYGVDSTTVRIPDSHHNRGFFGDHYSGETKGLSGYPLARLVTLMALRSHLIVAAEVGPYQCEREMAAPLWPKLPDASLVILDRGFRAAATLIPLHASGECRHWLTRAAKNSKWTVLKKLGRGDELVEVLVSADARRQHPALPATWMMRALHYQRPGFQPQTLLTSLCDPRSVSCERSASTLSRAMGARARLPRGQDRDARARRGHS
jgi:Insertion element 4 transposase N-terminal